MGVYKNELCLFIDWSVDTITILSVIGNRSVVLSVVMYCDDLLKDKPKVLTTMKHKLNIS